jgi:hypothetical protein
MSSFAKGALSAAVIGKDALVRRVKVCRLGSMLGAIGNQLQCCGSSVKRRDSGGGQKAQEAQERRDTQYKGQGKEGLVR